MADQHPHPTSTASAAATDPAPLLRISVTAETAGLDHAALVERMRSMFTSGIEEVRDRQGRFEVAAYETPPLTLPADLGPWRVELVGAERLRTWEELPAGQVVADRLWIGPPTEEPAPGLPAVWIEHHGVFGSGGHATTATCLELLCELEPPLAVLDVGSGSGVLAIAAVVLGHGPVSACDNDPRSVSATRENARRNGVAVEVFRADAVTDELPVADLWLVNIGEGPIAQVLGRADAPDLVIASGFRTGASTPAGYEVVRCAERQGWEARMLRRTREG